MEEVVQSLEEVRVLKENYRNGFVKYTLADELKSLYFNSKIMDEDGFVEYTDGLFIKNLTTDLLEGEGVAVFKIKVTKDVDVGLHSHRKQSQTVFITKGTVTCLRNNISFQESQSYFVSKETEHNTKYSKGTIAIIVYLPNLDRV